MYSNTLLCARSRALCPVHIGLSGDFPIVILDSKVFLVNDSDDGEPGRRSLLRPPNHSPPQPPPPSPPAPATES